MVKNPVRDFSGKILGYIQIEDNGDKKALDFTGKILGYYKSQFNMTTDFYGRVIARGDMVSSLIPLN